MRAFILLAFFASVICIDLSNSNLDFQGSKIQNPAISGVQRSTLEKVAASGLRNVIKERFDAMMDSAMEKDLSKIPHLNSQERGLLVQNSKYKAIDRVFDLMTNFIKRKGDRFSNTQYPRPNRRCSSIRCSRYVFPGPVGPDGFRGIKGNKGDTGSLGIKGEIGMKGFKGIKAIKGFKGFKGHHGRRGPSLKGLAGPQGDPERGEKGIKGLYVPSLKGTAVKGKIGSPGATLFCQGTVPYEFFGDW